MNDKSKKWVMRAASKDQARPKLTELSRLDGRVVACDGYRIHAWKGDDNTPLIEGYPDAIWFLETAMQGSSRVTISTYHLMQALKACLSLRKDDKYYIPLVKLCVSGSALYLESHSPKIGSITVYIRNGDNWPGRSTKSKYPNGRPNIAEYNLDGPALYIAFDPRYLIDALKGMGDQVTIIFKDNASPAYMVSGNHEAVIMPMILGA